MAVASFEGLCAGICEIAGVIAPALEPDESGLIAFHVQLRGVTVDFLHWPGRCAGSLFIVLALGTLSPHDCADAERLVLLLNANFVSSRQPQGVFARNPANGELVLQFAHTLFDATPHAVLDLVEQGVMLALQWRQRADDCGFPDVAQLMPNTFG